MKTYCVKEKKKTDCIPNSEEYSITANGRFQLKCICISCGKRKSTFVSEKDFSFGKGILDIPLKVAKAAEAVTKKVIPSTKPVFDRFWSGDIAKSAFDTDHGILSKKFWTRPSERHDPSCDTITYDKKKKKYVMGYCD